MSAEKLAFLQNFYTDVTLYVPAEAAVAPPVAAPAAPAVVTSAATAPMAPTPIAAAPPVASPARPAPLAEPAVAPPTRLATQPSTAFSKPSAGVERLTAAAMRLVPAEPVAPPAPAPPATRPVAPDVPPAMLTPFATLGDNMQGVLLLCRLPREEFVKLHRNVFLNKMLQALGLVMADVMLVNVEGELPVALVNLRRQLAATHIIAFGKNLLDVAIRNTQIYEPVQFPSLGLSYMASATIDLVEYDVSLKKRLWPGLQRMFLG